jgi:O-antigen/teichoic acid export membrane protein
VSVERTALSGLKWTGAARLIGQVLSWAVTLIVFRLLAPADYGIAAVSAAIISVISTVAELGLGASVVQAPALERDILRRLAGLALLLNWSLGAVVALSAPLAVVFFGEDALLRVIQVSALHFGLAAFSLVPEALAYRAMSFKWTASIDLIAGLVASLATLLLALDGAGVWALVLGGLAGATVRAALFLGTNPVWPVLRFGGLRAHVAFGGTLATSRLAWHVVSQADVFIAARFLTPNAVGLYSVSLHLATLPMQRIMGIVGQVVFPTVARLQDDRPRLRGRLLSGLRLLAFVSVPVMWGISAVAPEIVALALGPRWGDAVYPLQVASLLIPFKMASAVISTAIVGVGAATLDLRNTVVNLVVLPTAFLIGVRWGVDGLVTAWALSLVIVLALTVPRTCTRLEIALLDVARSLRDPLLAGGVMYAVVLGIRAPLGGMPDVHRLATLVLVGVGVYLPLVSFLNRAIWADLRRLRAASGT